MVRISSARFFRFVDNAKKIEDRRLACWHRVLMDELAFYESLEGD